MNSPVAMHPRHPPEDAMTLSFYAPDSVAARRLAEKLHAIARIQWIDSTLVAPLALAQSDQVGPVLLLDFLSPHAAHSSGLARELAGLMPGCSLVAVGSAAGEDAAGVLAALRTGVKEFVDIESEAGAIDTLLRKVLDAAGQARQAALAPVPARHARLVLLKGVRPGIGTSTLAVHLAVMAQRRWAAHPPAPGSVAGADRNHVLLLDLGRPAGDTRLYLDIEARYGYDELLRSVDRLDGTFVRTALASDPNGVVVVGEDSSAVQAPAGGREAAELVARLRTLFDVIVCDIGGLPDAFVPAALLQQADEIWLVTDQSIGALVSLDVSIQELKKQQLWGDKLKLVIDRYHENYGIGAAQIASRFDLPLLATLPERTRTMRASSGIGRLILDHAPRDPYLRAVHPLVDRLAPAPGPSPLHARPRPWQAIAHRLGISRWKRK